MLKLQRWKRRRRKKKELMMERRITRNETTTIHFICFKSPMSVLPMVRETVWVMIFNYTYFFFNLTSLWNSTNQLHSAIFQYSKYLCDLSWLLLNPLWSNSQQFKNVVRDCRFLGRKWKVWFCGLKSEGPRTHPLEMEEKDADERK